MSRSTRIAYLTSSYARATDTFIRDEVAGLRALGETVLTFSVRRPDLSEVVNEDIAREREQTTYLLELPRSALVTDLLRMALARPRHVGRAVAVARQLSRPGLRGRLWPVFYLLEAAALARRMLLEEVDHLHNHIAEGTASVALLASVLSDVPFSFTVHGPSEWDIPHEISLDLKAAHAAFVVAISEHTRGQVRRWVSPEDWDKVHVVRCGLPVLDSSGAVPSRDSTLLVSVGRLAPVKGHLILLRAIAALPTSVRSHLRLVVVGDGPERARLQRFVKAHGLDRTVELVGWRSTDEVMETLARSSALVMPSFAEGLPVSIMEAFSLGKPVISSSVGGVAELVEPGRSGWLVTPGSVPELTTALSELLAMDQSGRDRRGDHGRERVRADHDLAVEVGHLRSLIGDSLRPASRSHEA